MAKPPNVRQEEVDAAVGRIKAGQALAAAPHPPKTAIAAHFATSIGALEAQLAAVSDDLASNPKTVAPHADQLQALDLLAQGLARLRGQVSE